MPLRWHWIPLQLILGPKLILFKYVSLHCKMWFFSSRDKKMWWNTEKQLLLDRRSYSLLGPWSSHSLHRCQCCTAWQDHSLWSLLFYLPQIAQERGWLFYMMAVSHWELFSVPLLWVQQCWKNIGSNSWDSHCWWIGSIMSIHSFW